MRSDASSLASAPAALVALGALMAGPSPALAAQETVVYEFRANCQDCADAAGLPAFEVHGLLQLRFEPATVVTDAQFVRFDYAGSNLVAPFSVTLPGAGGDFEFEPGVNAITEANGVATDVSAARRAHAFGVTWGRRQMGFRTSAEGNWSLGFVEQPLDFGDSLTWARLASPVPEPAAGLSFAAGLAGLAAWVRRRRAAVRSA